MPKVTKKQQNASLDFSKAKTKLGRKAAPSNATSTAFKARSVALPMQGVSRDREHDEGKWKGKSIADLVAGTRHYAAGVRKDSLVSIQQLLSHSPSLQLSCASLLLSSLAPLISDADPGVRSTLHALHRFYLLSLPCAILAPHLPTLLLYTTSGMSHIYPDVRLDALRTLDVLLAAAPRAVAHGWDAHDTGAARVMAGYRDLLGLAQSANSTVASDLSAAAKVRLLSSLRSFVEAAASSARSDEAPKEDEAALRCPTWFFRPAFNSASVYDAFASAFTRASTPTLQLGQVPALLDATLAKPAGEAAWSNSDMQSSLSALQSSLAPAASASSSSSRASSKQTYASLFSSLAPLLLSSFLDSAPEAFSPSRDIAASSSGRTAAIPPLPLAAELCCVIVELTLVLWRAMGRCSQSGTGSGVEEEQAWRHLDSLLSKIDGYFPFSAFSSSSSSATNAGTSAPHPALAASDRRYAELSALHALHAPRAAGRSSKSLRGQQARLEQVQRHMRALLVDASSARFDWSAPLDSTSAPPPPPAATGSAVALEAAALVDLMPSLWLLLSQPRAECGEAEAEQSPQAVYADLLELWRTSRGETKRLTTHLLAFLSFAHTFPSYTSVFVPRPTALRRWIGMLPRHLWELGSKSPDASFVVLEVLRLYAVRCSSDELASLQPQLAPYFLLPQRADSSKASKGPYIRLPADVQRRAQGLLGFLEPLEEGLRRAASAVGAVAAQ